MEFADTLISRFDGEAEMKKANSVLICFSNLETGKVLSKLGIDITRSRSEKASITLLYFIDKTDKTMDGVDMDEYQHKVIADILPSEEKEKITMRLFIKSSENFHADIVQLTEELKCNLLLLGINNLELRPEIAKNYSQLKNDPTNSEAAIFEHFSEREAKVLKSIDILFNRNTLPTGLLMDSGVNQLNKLFIPILHKEDLHIFNFLARLAQKESVKIMIWDAIGIIQSDPKMQKFFQAIQKKTDGRTLLWDNDKKIGTDFIKEQDLLLIGSEGWNKLICTPLQWLDDLPSTLIIKEKTNA